ncbi:hypothetical protein AVEN_147179-1 [Araneus ventricosus]|uniref:Uncharacterized protein n=1 Tax=Araneus ventricosus TaxID=182803 RepID=A0A4Y2NP02_ARAVE|nr:hypothetical protein AVEN_147179-1 [Araneus ventricosus]
MFVLSRTVIFEKDQKRKDTNAGNPVPTWKNRSNWDSTYYISAHLKKGSVAYLLHLEMMNKSPNGHFSLSSVLKKHRLLPFHSSISPDYSGAARQSLTP